jgi:hypothetical protein
MTLKTINNQTAALQIPKDFDFNVEVERPRYTLRSVVNAT